MTSSFRLVGAAVLVLGAVAFAPSGVPAEEPATIELVWAASPPFADLVARRMRAGFLVDQLTIPGARHLGRAALSDLDSALRGALEKAGPGVPVQVPKAEGGLIVAQVIPRGPALLGATEYRQEMSRIGARIAVNPTNADLLGLDVPVDENDLAAVCEAKKKLVASDLEAARAAVAALSANAPVLEVMNARGRLAGALSFAGDIEGAIAAFEGIYARVQTEPPSPTRTAWLVMAREVLGILSLRRGEQENCVMHHNREMCLFPLSVAARHEKSTGGRQAMEYLTRALEGDPSNLEIRWLLNVAAMTIGAHPDGLPESVRIGPEVFQSTEDPGRFWDVAGPAGLARSDSAGGSVADDFDDDGLFDIVVSSRDPCEPLRLFRNRGDGTFADETEKSGLAAQLGGLNVVQTDYNNDGRIDLFVMRGGWETPVRNSLLRNDGGGVFTDVTATAGLGGDVHRTHSAAWADYDNDGWLDVFIGHEMSFSQLFRNRRDGTFEDVTEAAGLRYRSLTKGVSWGDIDNDGWADLYVSNFGERNLLFHNLGHGRFEEIAADRGVSEPYYSFATWFWDYDNDGWQDLLVVTDLPSVEDQPREYLGLPPLGETMRVYRNRGGGRFDDVTKALGLARNIPTMGANFGDIDNDGYLDMYLGTGAPSYAMLIPNRLFRNQAGRAFVDVTQATGTGHLQKGHGVSFADFDNDGDDDLFANMGGAYLGDKYPDALFENPGHDNDWIAIRLVGTRANRAAVGARIVVVLEEGQQETQRIRSVTSGGSFGASPFLQHVGLGPHARLKRIELEWPGTRTRQTLSNVPVNRFIEITEGKSGFRLLKRPTFRLGGPAK